MKTKPIICEAKNKTALHGDLRAKDVYTKTDCNQKMSLRENRYKHKKHGLFPNSKQLRTIYVLHVIERSRKVFELKYPMKVQNELLEKSIIDRIAYFIIKTKKHNHDTEKEKKRKHSIQIIAKTFIIIK